MCTFLDIVGEEYDALKENFRRIIVSEGMRFDEDVFSDTLLKCQERFDNEDVGRDDAVGYFWKSFRNNTIRERYYHRNCLKADLGEHDAVSFEDDSVMLKNVLGGMSKEFGVDRTEMFLRHASGESYKDIGQGFDKYRYDEMTEYLRAVI